MRQFTLKQLRYFVTAGELSSVTQAARKLHVSQPSISGAIQQIEEVTGLQLFVRHHAQGLSLTPPGKQLMNRARHLLHDAEALQQYARSLGKEIRGELRLVAFPTFAPVLLPRLLRRYADFHASVSLYCDEMHQADIVRGLQQGGYELAFTYNLEIPEGIDFRALYRFPAYAVVATDHPLAKHDRIELAELVAWPMVLLDWPLSREYFLSIFTSHGLAPVVAHRAKSLDMVRGLVANGFGFSLFNTPLTALQGFGGNGLKQLRLEDDVPPLLMGLAYLHGLQLSPAAEAMYRLIQDSETRAEVFAQVGSGSVDVATP
ncbi:MAG TPA: LysR family transcriptional regulator [Gammaproteobacteria bacterium]|nr:LysR family transcriptional regulator [Gammaproteobacteria bacterium]